MWWNDEGFNKPITDKNGRLFSFKVWHGAIDKVYLQRIFFWDSKKEITGMVEFKEDQTIHFKRIKDRLIKLVRNKEYRAKFACPLNFPIEKNY